MFTLSSLYISQSTLYADHHIRNIVNTEIEIVIVISTREIIGKRGAFSNC